MREFFTILAAMVVSAIVMVGMYLYVPISWFEWMPTLEKEKSFGATITTIQGTDTLKDSRAVINTNFSNLNTDKIEVATTSVGNIITLSGLTTAGSLATVGTITSGRWNGTPILSAYGGTGTTTFPAYHVLVASSTGAGIMSVSGLGTSGQFLTSQGAGAFPQWTTSSVDLGIAYIWTAEHTFKSASSTTLFAASSTISRLSTSVLTASSSATFAAATVQGNLRVNGQCLAGCAATTTFVTPGAATDYTQVTQDFNGGLGVLSYTDAQDARAFWATQVPLGVTGISSIQILYEGTSGGNLNIAFGVTHLQGQVGSFPIAETTDTVAATTYTATGGNNVSALAVPSTAYDGLSSITEGDIISVDLRRDSSGAPDTFDAAWLVKGIIFVWQ